MRTFKSTEIKALPDGRTIYAVKADRKMNRDDTGLVMTWVRIDGIPKKIKAVEKFAKAGPIQLGEEIGLVV